MKRLFGRPESKPKVVTELCNLMALAKFNGQTPTTIKLGKSLAYEIDSYILKTEKPYKLLGLDLEIIDDFILVTKPTKDSNRES